MVLDRWVRRVERTVISSTPPASFLAGLPLAIVVAGAWRGDFARFAAGWVSVRSAAKDAQTQSSVPTERAKANVVTYDRVGIRFMANVSPDAGRIKARFSLKRF